VNKILKGYFDGLLYKINREDRDRMEEKFKQIYLEWTSDAL
jgi:hypothetical protein